MEQLVVRMATENPTSRLDRLAAAAGDRRDSD
jgi:hypothetical protein